MDLRRRRLRIVGRAGVPTRREIRPRARLQARWLPYGHFEVSTAKAGCLGCYAAPFAQYLAARFADDPHLWATALYDEVVPLAYGQSYVSFARQLRLAGLRPHCEPCAGVSGRETIEIGHPAGEEMQWDWFERRKAPWGGTAYVLLGTLPHSGRVQSPGQYRRLTHAHAAATGVTRQGARRQSKLRPRTVPRETATAGGTSPRLCTFRAGRCTPITANTPASRGVHHAVRGRGPSFSYPTAAPRSGE